MKKASVSVSVLVSVGRAEESGSVSVSASLDGVIFEWNSGNRREQNSSAQIPSH
jgi:hypothetical protein